MGVDGVEAEPSVQLLQAMSYANDQTMIGPPDAVAFLNERRGAFTRRWRDLMIFLSIVLVLGPYLVFAHFYTGDAYCMAGVLAVLLGMTIFLVTLLSWFTVLEEPSGYWKRSDQDYDKAVEKMERMLWAEEHIPYQKADASRFFQVGTRTTFYLLDIDPPPVYIIVWKDGDKALIHLGPRTEKDPHQHKELASRIAWST